MKVQLDDDDDDDVQDDDVAAMNRVLVLTTLAAASLAAAAASEPADFSVPSVVQTFMERQRLQGPTFHKYARLVESMLLVSCCCCRCCRCPCVWNDEEAIFAFEDLRGLFRNGHLGVPLRRDRRRLRPVPPASHPFTDADAAAAAARRRRRRRRRRGGGGANRNHDGLCSLFFSCRWFETGNLRTAVTATCSCRKKNEFQ